MAMGVWLWGHRQEGTDGEDTGVGFPRIYSHVIFPHSDNKDIKRMYREGREPEEGEGGRAWGCGTVKPVTRMPSQGDCLAAV